MAVHQRCKLLVGALLVLGVLGAPVSADERNDKGVQVSILGTTDVHGHIYPTNYYHDAGDEALGVARVQTLIKRERTRNPNVLLVDSGDCLQGTPLTYYHARIATHAPNPMVAAYNLMGFDAFAIGNHEYNYGISYLEKARRESRYPFLSANIYHHGTDKLVYRPWVIKTVDQVRIGVIGFTTPGVAVWDRKHVSGKQDFGDIIVAAKREIPRVKAAGVDAIVVIIHSGLGAPYDSTFSGYAADEGIPEENACAHLAEACPDIDAILLGHSHKDLPKLLHHGVLLTQAKKWGERLAVVDLSFQKVDNRWRLTGKDARTLSTEGVPPDEAILAASRQAHEATLRYVRTPIAKSSVAWTGIGARTQDIPLMDLISEVQREAAQAQLSAVSVFNSNAHLPKGRITVADLAALYVYENTLTRIRLTGQQLRDYLEFSASFYKPYAPGQLVFDDSQPAYNQDLVAGVDYAIDVRQPVGSRIVVLRYQGRDVMPKQTFTMAVNSYRQNGGGGYTMLKQATLEKSDFPEIRELLIEQVKRWRTISPEKVFKANWRLLPAGGVASDGRQYQAVN